MALLVIVCHCLSSVVILIWLTLSTENPVACLQQLAVFGLFRVLFELPEIYTVDDSAVSRID